MRRFFLAVRKKSVAHHATGNGAEKRLCQYQPQEINTKTNFDYLLNSHAQSRFRKYRR